MEFLSQRTILSDWPYASVFAGNSDSLSCKIVSRSQGDVQVVSSDIRFGASSVASVSEFDLGFAFAGNSNQQHLKNAKLTGDSENLPAIYQVGSRFDNPSLKQVQSLFGSLLMFSLYQISGICQPDMIFEHLECIGAYARICRIQLADYRKCRKHKKSHSTSKVYFVANLDALTIKEFCHMK